MDRAAGSRLPAGHRAHRSGSRWAQLPYAIAVAGTAGGLAWTGLAARHARNGMLAVACAMLIAAVARLVLPEHRAGMLASRRRLVDVAALACFGTGILIIALVLPRPS